MAALHLDPLFCEEQHWEPDDLLLNPEPDHRLLSSPEAPADGEWADLLATLSAKEKETHPEPPTGFSGDAYLASARRGLVDWVAAASARHGFSALTVLLAVGYLDRCFLGGGLSLQADRPWMARLSAVACLSLAAKVEETHVPHILDLQAAAAAEDEEVGYLFEAKTVRRMELLVLSALGWRMNPVTPLSFIHHLIPKLHSYHQGELLTRCHAILLSVVADAGWNRHPASVWAAATLKHAAGSTETMELIALLNLSNERLGECCQLISESMAAGAGFDVPVGNKRKHHPYSHCFYDLDYFASPPSPDAVIGSCFSCNSSSNVESWAMWPLSVSSSPEHPLFKRSSSIARGFD